MYFWWLVVLVLLTIMITFLTLWFLRPNQTNTFSTTPVITPSANDTEFLAASGVLIVDTKGNEVLEQLAKADLQQRLSIPIPLSFTYLPEDLLPIRDQKKCGTCYLFNTLDALGDRIKLQSKGELAIPLSVAQMASCGTSGNGTDLRLDCGNGGYIDAALKDLERVGVIPEVEYPYGDTYDGLIIPDMATGTVPKCQIRTSLYRAFAKQAQVLRSGAIQSLTVGSEEHLQIIRRIKEELYIRGPLMSTLALHKVSNESNQIDLMQYPYGTTFTSGTGPLAFYHVVSLIGWHQPKEDSFEGAYWWARNSWNPAIWPRGTPTTDDLGGGFFRIAMGTNAAEVEQRCITFTPVVYKDGQQVAFRNAPTFLNRFENQVVYDNAYRIFLLSGIFVSGFLVTAASLAWWKKWDAPREVKYAIWIFILLGLALVFTLYLTAYKPVNPLQTNTQKTVGETASASGTLQPTLALQLDETILKLWEGHIATASRLYTVNTTSWTTTLLFEVPEVSSYTILDIIPYQEGYFIAWRLPVVEGLVTYEVMYWDTTQRQVWHNWVTESQEEHIQLLWTEGALWIMGFQQIARKTQPTDTLDIITTGLLRPYAKIQENHLWLLDREKIYLWRIETWKEPFILPETPWLSGNAPEWLLLGPILSESTLWIADEWAGRIYVVTNGIVDSELYFEEGLIKALDNWTVGTVIGTQTGALYIV